jgi:hypothetical protein
MPARLGRVVLRLLTGLATDGRSGDAMDSLHPPPLWALLIGAAIIMLVLLLLEILIPVFDWIDRLS